jgi:hypothetical protein
VVPADPAGILFLEQPMSARPGAFQGIDRARAPWRDQFFPATPFEPSRWRGGRYAYAKDAADSAPE